MKKIITTLCLLITVSLFAFENGNIEPNKNPVNSEIKNWFEKNPTLSSKKIIEEGTVYVSFSFNEFGNPENIEIIHEISTVNSSDTFQKVIEMVKEMKITDPNLIETENGKKYILPIKFKKL